MTGSRTTGGDDAALEAVRSDALRLLKARSRTRRELSDRLVKKGHAKSDIGTLLNAFERSGLIDDETVARAHAASALARAPRGESWLRQSLRRRGIEAELATRIAREAMHDRDPLADAMALASRRAALAKRHEPPEATSRRVMAFLARRGYDIDVCKRAVAHAMRQDVSAGE